MDIARSRSTAAMCVYRCVVETLEDSSKPRTQCRTLVPGGLPRFRGAKIRECAGERYYASSARVIELTVIGVLYSVD
jgi:hypothetical protein